MLALTLTHDTFRLNSDLNNLNSTKPWRPSSSLRQSLIYTHTTIKPRHKNVSLRATPSHDSLYEEVKVKEWENGVLEDKLRATQDIRIRRRQPTRPPFHYDGPFKLHLLNDVNYHRKSLEEILKIDVEHGRKDMALRATRTYDSLLEELTVARWENGILKDALAATLGIRIRRRKPNEPPLGYSGRLRYLLKNEEKTPRNILEEIIWHKDVEVTQMKEKNPLVLVNNDVVNAPSRDFVESLKASYKRTAVPALIAEVKKASPSRGILREDFHPVEIAKAYEKGGAACLSVLTDSKFFQGGFENLEAIRSAGIKCPLLCKDFIVDPWQLYYARTKGADAVTLIAAVFPDYEITYMLKICKDIGLTALVEVHDENEMDRMLAIDGIELIGINNRNLGTFEVDIGNTKKLLEGERGVRIRQKNIIVVGESGLFTPADISYAKEAGVKAVLVGESIVKQKDPANGIMELFGKDISV